VREAIAVVFRRRTVVITAFLLLALLAGTAAYLQPVSYWGRVRLLITRDRVDATVTPAPGMAAMIGDVSDKDLQSEALILQSRDLLRPVVTACGLTEPATWLQRALRPIRGGATEQPTDGILMDLSRRLRIAVVDKSNLIEVSYPAATRAEATCVIETLSRDYVQKHLALQRPSGTLRFFEEAADGYRQSLEAAELRLREFGRDLGTGAVDLQTDLKVRRLSEAEALLEETNAGIEELTERAATLQTQLEATPERRTTAVRTTDNGQLMERLQSTLLDLELKRLALAARYDSSYLPLQDLENQIARTREALATASANPLVDSTTDSDPAHDWLRSELTRTGSELSALRARAVAASRTVQSYRNEIRSLNDRSIEHQDLQRQVRTQEESYLLYLRKQEEARIAQALDSQGITNVVVAEPPNVPNVPSSLRFPILLAGMAFAAIAALLLAFLIDAGDRSFRTPEEVRQVLGVPVLASFPRGEIRTGTFGKTL
jgi:uncharacterized protein involved in exopolysaccharide biosynthesis